MMGSMRACHYRSVDITPHDMRGIVLRNFSGANRTDKLDDAKYPAKNNGRASVFRCHVG